MSRYTQLAQEQRYTIWTLLKEHTQTYIASKIGVCKSTVCHEVRRNRGKMQGATPIEERPVIVERKTADAVGVVVRLLRGAGRRVHTITSDNGLEFAGHKAIAQALRAKFYFAHPYASWERGANENANGLVRQYLPKGADFTAVTDAELAHIMQRLNSRPRKCLDMKTPNEVFFGKHRKSNGVAVGS